jgi:uncharacterized protein YcaQ
MYVLPETDINKLIVACNKVAAQSIDQNVRREYQHLINRLSNYKEQNFPKL